MSTPTLRQPAGTPVGGQFAATARGEGAVDLSRTAAGCSCTEAETCDACIDAPTVQGLTVPAGLDEPTRQLVDALEAAGLNGTVTFAEFVSPGWSRVEVALPSGHELSVGIARQQDSNALRTAGDITAITATLRAGDDIDYEDPVDMETYGGGYGTVAIGETVRQALIASAARAEFADRFPDAAADGCTLAWIGQQNAQTAWRRIADPQQQMDGARFTVPGGEVLVTTLDGDVEIEAAGRPLSAKESYLRELAAADVARRLGLGAAGSAAETLATTVADIIATARRRPVVAANVRNRG